MTAAFPIPDAVLRQHVIVLGKTRSGKSTTLRDMVEHLLLEEKPVAILDPKGDWWGLKSSADGKKPGFPVIIFGGKHADLPLNPRAGAEVGELVATGNRPCIIDLGEWMPGDRTRFFVDFAAALFRKTQGMRWLVIDEVHNFAPQGKVLDPDSGKMLHWANRIINEGGGKGLTLLAASQRPQKVHKDYLTANETLIAMRVIHKLDRDAVKDWIDGAPDPALGRQVLADLANMARGEAWVWSPEAKFGPLRMQFPMFSTYDSFKPSPEQEAPAKLKGWASVDLDEVREKLAAVEEEAKANDPKVLKAELALLRRQMTEAAAAAAKSGGAVNPAAIAEAEGRGRRDGYNEATTNVAGILQPAEMAIVGLRTALIEAERAAKALDQALGRARPEKLTYKSTAHFRKPADSAGAKTEATAPPADKRTAPNPVPRQVGSSFSPQPEADGELTPAKRRILVALRQLEAIGKPEADRDAVGWFAGASPTSSGYANNLGSLRSAGLIDYPGGGKVKLTEAGKDLVPEMPAPSHEDVLALVRDKVSPAQYRLLEAAIAAYPDDIGSEELAEAAGASPTSSGFANNKGRLRSLGLIDYPSQGRVRAGDVLFP
jgi:hypothetical protein